MRLRLLAPALLLLAVSTPAAAQRSAEGGLISFRNADSVVRIVPRRATAGTRDELLTRDGMAVLVLGESSLVLQLTDAGLEEVRHELQRDAATESAGGRIFLSFVGGFLRSFLDHGLAYELLDLGDARVQDGRLRLTRVDGTELFGQTEIRGRKLAESFDEGEARAFAARVRARRGQLARMATR